MTRTTLAIVTACGFGAATILAAQDPAARPAPAQPPATRAALPSRASTTPAPPADVQAVVTRYCLSCHSDRLKTGNLSLENRDYAHPAADPQARRLPATGPPGALGR